MPEDMPYADLDSAGVGDFDIAIIGMAGRFPGAANLDEFWRNLAAGVESVGTFTNEEVLAAGIDPALVHDPHYVKAGGVLDDAEEFDARFFGIYPREAEIMDPQQRVFLEVAWEALENAGYDSATYAKMIGVFAGAGLNSYLLFNLLENSEIRRTVQPYHLTIANDKDFLATRVSYKLNLRGPSIAVQTACSTSLVATHLACQALLNYQCDMALAGGVTIRLPQRGGYLYQEGGIASPDGHCRAFDADAAGTVGGNGAGIVVLKRLADALAERDTIHAVIKATALNNDGSSKVGYTAPSVEGQTEVVATAQALAGVDARTISYIETHGTGTALGDPIEIAALTEVFRQSTALQSPDLQFCAIGSLKTNIGHLDAAAGVASLIKTALALEHRQIPPSLNYSRPNPRIDFAGSPFYVNTSLRDWQPEAGAGTDVRRAGVSAFGIGGTNAHAVLEEAPPRLPSGPSRRWQLLALSARSSAALARTAVNLAAHLTAAGPTKDDPAAYLADVAYTLKVGRRAFEHRRIELVSDLAEAVSAPAAAGGPRVLTNDGAAEHRSVAFMFTGQGSQYPDMAAGQYRTEPVFRTAVDECARLLLPHLGLDVRTLILPGDFPGASGEVEEALRHTAITQPALFVVEYALAQLWLAWGVHPDAMIGHSIGEYVAACLAGVLTLADALAVVAARGRLMAALPGGAMLSVPLSESDVRERLRKPEAHGLALAAVNAPALSVVSGPFDAIDRFEQTLLAEGIAARRLHTSHAFHSPMMDSILSPFAEVMRGVRLSPPTLPYISNVTGTWITAEQATDPAYYAQHLRQAVRFADGLSVLAEDPARALLEVGPGHTLATLARQHPAVGQARAVIASLPGPVGTRRSAEEQVAGDDQAFALMALGRLWLAGIVPDWDPEQGRPGQPWAAFYAGEARTRVPLPTYPFEHERYWVEPSAGRTADDRAVASIAVEGRRQAEDWLYACLWQQAPPLPRPAASPQHWLAFAHDDESDRSLLAALTQTGLMQVTAVMPGPAFAGVGETSCYEVRPGNPFDYAQLFDALAAAGRMPQGVLHLWAARPGDWLGAAHTADNHAEGFDSLIALVRAWSAHGGGAPLRVAVVTTGVADVTGNEPLHPDGALVLGACRVISQEHPNITCQVIDLADRPGSPPHGIAPLQLLAELHASPVAGLSVYRAGRRWLPMFGPLGAGAGAVPLHEQGLYLITGGLGRIGSVLAEHLAASCRARLALLDRSGLPPQETWDGLLAGTESDSSAARKVRHIRRLQELGSEVLVLQADITDPVQMAAALTRVDEHFGPDALRGVIHAAGLVGAAAIKAVTEITAADRDAQFAPKVDGTRALAGALGHRPLDFVLLMSSLSTVLGGLGFAAYAAANSFLEAFAAQQRRSHPQQGWLSVAWEGWDFPEEDALGRAVQARAAGPVNYSLSPAEGAAVFDRVLALGTDLAHVIVSTGDLAARRARWAVQADEDLAAETAEDLATSAAARHYARPNLRTPYVAAGDDLQAAIVADWEDVLGIAPIGVEDDFFELGGHSLLATQIVSRLRDTYQVDLPLRNIFETPTVAGLAALIRAGQSAADAARVGTPAGAPTLHTIPTVPRAIGEDGLSLLPLSYGQQRLWFLDRLDPGSPLYNNFAALRLTAAPAGAASADSRAPAIDATRLQAALAAVVERHEVLRTVFVERGGVPVQRILQEMPVALAVTDLRPGPGRADSAAVEAEVLRLAQVEARAPFDLTTGPLFRVHLLHIGGNESVLFFTMHHIVSDGWSVGVLLHEVTALLSTEDGASMLPELPIQYADYAAWERAWLAGTPSGDREGTTSQLGTQLAYWRTRLADGPPPLELPTDRPRPAVQTSQGANHWFTLPASLYEQLDALARSEGATLFMALLAGLNVLLYRYTGQSDLTVGTPIANRGRTETEPLIGFLLNTLVLRTRVLPDFSFRELLRQVREVALGAYAHQDVPFEMLVEALQPARDMSRAPFFQVMFDLQAAPLEGLALPGLALSGPPLRLDVDPGTAKFDLALSMEYSRGSTSGSLGGYLNYNRDLFDGDTIAQMLGHFEALLTAAVRDPNRPLARLPMLSGEEEHRILNGWNAAAQPATLTAPAGETVLEMFEAQVRTRPAAVAAILAADAGPHADWREELTYAGLDARAEALAHELKARGIGPESIVALQMERSLDIVTAIIAVLKAGAAFLPIDPSTPPERIRFMLEDSGASIVLTQTQGLDGRSFAAPGNPHSTSNVQHSLAYVIYTSGSTGRPKGVLIEAGDLARHIRTVAATFDLRPGDRILQFAAYTFDQGIEQILTALAVGGTLVMRGTDVWPPAEFPRAIASYGLTSVNLPPAYLAQVLQEWSRSQLSIPEGQLRTIISGGDILPAEILRLWQSTPARSARLLNAYGPTETTITALVFDVPPDWFEDGPGREGRPVPIGQPLAGRAAYVVDRSGNLVPAGVPGELLLGGVGIARGYLARPELTAEKFVPHPFSRIEDCRLKIEDSSHTGTQSSIRLYRTGDLVRRRRDGYIEFMGRIDQQVKIRGFRIELGEIETMLLQQPGVRQAAVVAQPDAGGMQQLVAYFVPSGGPQATEPAPTDLRAALGQALPAYMVPAAYVRLEQLPLTPTGKVDRRALPAPDGSALATTGERIAPRTAIERELAAVWTDVLGLSQGGAGAAVPIGVYDNFFDLGGHSLLATQIVSRLRELYPVELPLRKLFEAPTVASLAAVVEEALIAQHSEEELLRLLDELEGLPDDEGGSMRDEGGTG